MQAKAEANLFKLIEQVRAIQGAAGSPPVHGRSPSLFRLWAPVTAPRSRAQDLAARRNRFGGDFNASKPLNLKSGRPWPAHMEILVNTIQYAQPAEQLPAATRKEVV
jgi:hypothetical protein